MQSQDRLQTSHALGAQQPQYRHFLGQPLRQDSDLQRQINMSKATLKHDFAIFR
jgi:hypothetical protein